MSGNQNKRSGELSNEVQQAGLLVLPSEVTKARIDPCLHPVERNIRTLMCCVSALMLFLGLSSPGFGAEDTNALWSITGSGSYLESVSGGASLANNGALRFDAKVSPSAYRIEVSYNNLRDVMVYDGINTVVYRMIQTPGGIAGTDVLVLPGSFPERLPGYLQASWAASYANIIVSQDSTSDVVNPLCRSEYMLRNFGGELAGQAVIRQSARDGSLQFGVYIPGNATKDGRPVFYDAPYQNGVMFQRLKFEARHPVDRVYRNVELADCVLYRDPTSPEDVRDLDRHVLAISAVTRLDKMQMELPTISGNILVTDYSIGGGTNGEYVQYRLSNWKEFKAVQKRAKHNKEIGLASERGKRSRAWIVIVVFMLISAAFAFVALKSKSRAKAKTVNNENNN